MKKNSSFKNVDLMPPKYGCSKKKEEDSHKSSPFKLNLDFKKQSSKPSSNHIRTIKSVEKTNYQQQSTQFLTDRTNLIPEFDITQKDMSQSFSSTKGFNIKSFIRIKPNPYHLPVDSIQFKNKQTIVCQRSVYKFDHILDSFASQNTVYDTVGKEVTNKFMKGYNCTIFAYGNTGSGKTFTMFGNQDGIVPSVVEDIFSQLDTKQCKLSCSLLQIYRQNLIDLLATEPDPQLKIKDNPFSIQNLAIHPLRSQQDAQQLLAKGNNLKKIRQTSLNESSSRSHLLFTLYLQKTDENNKPIYCRFNLVDLAGSQKVLKSKVEGQGLQQAKKINYSLSRLGNTINALANGNTHIPFRQSKLTRILRDSFIGNSITRLIITCSLTEDCFQQTISSMKFAQRARKIQTQAQVSYQINKFKIQKNQHYKSLLKQNEGYKQKINKIRQILNHRDCLCQCCSQIKQLLNLKQNFKTENISEKSSEMLLIDPKFTFNSPTNISNPRSFFSRDLTNMKSLSKVTNRQKPTINIDIKSMIKNQSKRNLKSERKIIRIDKKSKISSNKQNINPSTLHETTNNSKDKQQFIENKQFLKQLHQTMIKLEQFIKKYVKVITPIEVEIQQQQINYLQSLLVKNHPQASKWPSIKLFKQQCFSMIDNLFIQMGSKITQKSMILKTSHHQKIINKLEKLKQTTLDWPSDINPIKIHQIDESFTSINQFLNI